MNVEFCDKSFIILEKMIFFGQKLVM